MKGGDDERGRKVEAKNRWSKRVEYHNQVEVSRWSEEAGGEE